MKGMCLKQKEEQTFAAFAFSHRNKAIGNVALNACSTTEFVVHEEEQEILNTILTNT